MNFNRTNFGFKLCPLKVKLIIFKDKLIEFGKYISTLEPNDVPNYDLIRSILNGTTKLSSKTQKVAKKTTATKNNKTDEVQHVHKMVLRQRK